MGHLVKFFGNLGHLDEFFEFLFSRHIAFICISKTLQNWKIFKILLSHLWPQVLQRIENLQLIWASQYTNLAPKKKRLQKLFVYSVVCLAVDRLELCIGPLLQSLEKKRNIWQYFHCQYKYCLIMKTLENFIASIIFSQLRMFGKHSYYLAHTSQVK